MPSRSWRGWGLRWSGDAGAVAKPQPVTLVGHDSSDGGGMRGASISVTDIGGVNDWTIVSLTSELGFAVWTILFPAVTYATIRFLVQEADPLPGVAPAGGFLYGVPRDVTVRGAQRVVPADPFPVGGLVVPLAASAGIPSLVTFARPLIVPPRMHLLIFSPAPGTGATFLAPTVLFEEGL